MLTVLTAQIIWLPHTVQCAVSHVLLLAPAPQGKLLPFHAAAEPNLLAMPLFCIIVVALLLQLMSIQGPSFFVSCHQQLTQLAPPVACMQTMRSKFTEKAKSGTLEEIFDNCKCWLKATFEKAAQDNTAVFVSWDNAPIHNFKQRLAELGLDATKLIALPPHSPDLHQLIEHVFGRLKRALVVALYYMGWQNATPEKVRDAVLSLLDNTRDTVCTPALLQKDLKNLINCYKIVEAPYSRMILINDHYVHGSAGDWPPKGYR
jgi:hypothetical protein